MHRPDIEKLPSNYQDLMQLITRPRSSLSPSVYTEQKYIAFHKAVNGVRTEADVFENVLLKIAGGTVYPGHRGQNCLNWAPLFEDVELTGPQPDKYEGLEITEEDRMLREHLDKFIVPAHDGEFLPNFFVEGKNPDGSARIVLNQAIYHGTLGCRGIHETRVLAEEDATDEKACTFSATYSARQLTLYAHFVRKYDDDSDARHYQMWQIGSWVINGSSEQARVAMTAFRNVRDEACKIRTALAKAASLVLEDARRRGDELEPPVPPVLEGGSTVADHPSVAQLDLGDGDDSETYQPNKRRKGRSSTR